MTDKTLVERLTLEARALIRTKGRVAESSDVLLLREAADRINTLELEALGAGIKIDDLERALASTQPAEAVEGALGRFGHHPDPATDFEVEVESLQGRLFNARHGIAKMGERPETVGAVTDAIERAMRFKVGADPGAVYAKSLLRALVNEAPTDAAQGAVAQWMLVEQDIAFADWLVSEIPPNTIISNPQWWAPRIARAYRRTHPTPDTTAAELLGLADRLRPDVECAPWVIEELRTLAGKIKESGT